MNNSLYRPGAPARLIPWHADTRAWTRSAGSAAVAAATATWAFLKVVCNLSAELERIADEWESTRPEQAARMREVARRGWDW